MTTAIISVTGVTKNYRTNKVLKGLDWQVNSGEIVALLGQNGAGKSTLLECIMNIRQFNSGELRLWGYSWDDLPQEKREKIAYVAEEANGFEWMGAYDYVDYLGGFFRDYDQVYAHKLLKSWGILSNSKISELSKGQKQIVHIIQAFSCQAELLILDEPVAHLDPAMRRKFISELIDLAYKNNMTVIFSSHIVSDVERIASHVAVLKNGNITLEYEIEQLKSNIAHVKISAEGLLQQSEYYHELSSWQSYAQGAIAQVVKPLSQGLDKFIKDSPQQIEYTPMSLEDWYLEVYNAAD
ncbi:MAG TPA: ABC transporter ATP-binding protein [Oceanospirillales bacterium]|nr:ABC transporter ATP-binding protein [Oceanospirillales bacterium]